MVSGRILPSRVSDSDFLSDEMVNMNSRVMNNGLICFCRKGSRRQKVFGKTQYYIRKVLTLPKITKDFSRTNYKRTNILV